MKPDIHPTFYTDATVTCASCGKTWTTGSTHLEDIKTREESKVSPDRPIAELELSSRSVDALAKAGIKKVGQFLDKLADGDDTVLAIDGFGQKSLVDVKKKLRALGYELPEKVK